MNLSPEMEQTQSLGLRMTKAATHPKPHWLRHWIARFHPLRLLHARRIRNWYERLDRVEVERMPKEPRGWIPVNIHFDRDRVAWTHLGDQTFREPFFYQTIHRLASSRRPPPVRATSSAALLEQGERFDGLAPSGFIFHVSRCGSTLLANMCSRLSRNLVVAEATPINAILRHHMARTGSPRAAARLRAVIAAFGAAALPTQRHFIIKLSSWNLFLIPLIERAFPGVPRVILYRDPLEVMASNLRQPGWWFREKGGYDPAALIGTEAARGHESWDEATHGVRILAGLFRAARDHGRRNTLLLCYQDLSPEVLTPVLEHFGIATSAQERDHMAQALAVYSKDPRGRQAHGRDRSQKQTMVSEEIRSLIENHLAEPYQALQRHPARIQ